MPAAFECWNDSGYMQIDSRYPNLRMVQRGAVYCDQAIPQDTNPLRKRYYRDIVVSASNPVIAFRCGTHCSSIGIGFDGNTYTHRFYTEGQAYVDYWAFADAPAPISAGLEIYSESGQLVFTSKDQPAKVMGQLQPPSMRFGDVAEYNIAGVRQLALIQNGGTFAVRGDGRSAWIYSYGARVTGAGTVNVSFDIIQVTPPAYTGGEIFASFMNYTLLDTYGQ